MLCGAVLSFIVIILSGLGDVTGDDADLTIIDAIEPEQPCLAAGGMCTIATDCPVGQLSNERGLCPKQRDRGVECCHGISMKETRCAKHGGMCISTSKVRCNERLIATRATDCLEYGKQCCILV